MGSLIGLTLLILSATPLSAEGERPRLLQTATGTFVLRDLPPILVDDSVHRQLHSGLTVGFAVEVEVAGEELDPGYLIQVRYELWDENYRVAVQGREVDARTLASRDEFVEWWSGIELWFTDRVRADDPAGSVTLRLIPFSRSEQMDAQQWFTESVRRASKGDDDRIRAAGETPSSLDRILETLLATSIRRRPLKRWQWDVEIEVEVAP